MCPYLQYLFLKKTDFSSPNLKPLRPILFRWTSTSSSFARCLPISDFAEQGFRFGKEKPKSFTYFLIKDLWWLMCQLQLK